VLHSGFETTLRRGYRRSGEVSDYPLNAAGIPLQPELKIETLEKTRLAASDEGLEVNPRGSTLAR
jgi:hypothetical protein